MSNFCGRHKIVRWCAGHWVIAVIMALGACLRLFHVSYHGVWYDEACSIINAQYSLLSDVFMQGVGYKPLYFLLLKVWTYMFGTGAWSVRLPSVLCAVLSIYYMYVVGRKLFNTRVACSAAFLLAVSCMHIYHSQQARHFTALVLLVILSFDLVHAVLKSRFQPRLCLLHVTCLVALVLMHPYAIAIVVTQYAIMFAFIRREKISVGHGLYGYIALAVCLAGWFCFAMHTRMVAYTWWISRLCWQNVAELFTTFACGAPRYGLDDFKISYAFPLCVSVLIGLYSLFFLIGIYAKTQWSLGKRIVLFWFCVPIVLVVVVSAWWPILAVKHLIIVLPAYCYLVALGIDAVCKTVRKALMILGVLFLFSLYPLGVLYSVDHNIDWRGAVDYFKMHAGEREYMVLSTLKEARAFVYYYMPNARDVYRRMDVGGMVDESGIVRDRFSVGNVQIFGIKERQKRSEGYTRQHFDYVIRDFLELDREERRDFWFMASRWTDTEDYQYMVHFFEQKGYASDTKQLRGIAVHHFMLAGRTEGDAVTR